MPKLRITLACDQYDLVKPLLEGKVVPQGIDLNVLTVDAIRHDRMIKYEEYDACEFSLSAYFVVKEKRLPFTAIPVFIRRMFGHKFFFVNAASGIKSPLGLVGKRVGINRYENTLSLWVRGYLKDEWGISPDKINWFTARKETVDISFPKGVSIQQIPPGKNLEDMLLQGEIEAMVIPHLIKPFLQGSPRVKRLFPDFKKAEIEYYQKTKIFPIMHLIILKEKLWQENPWIATSLLGAFEEAKKLCFDFMEDPTHLSLAWGRALLEEEKKILGRDLWPYNLKDNLGVLETMIRYSKEQGIIKTKLPVKELFAENTRGL